MGVHVNIAVDKFPQQSSDLHRRAEVIFHYYSSRSVMGTIVRDDVEEPFLTIIRLDDGRYVLATECQYSPLRIAPPPAVQGGKP